MEDKYGYEKLEFVKNPRGHVWKRDEDGVIEIGAYSEGDIHNGPRCVKCGYGFCRHCNGNTPQDDCAAL